MIRNHELKETEYLLLSKQNFYHITNELVYFTPIRDMTIWIITFFFFFRNEVKATKDQGNELLIHVAPHFNYIKISLEALTIFLSNSVNILNIECFDIFYAPHGLYRLTLFHLYLVMSFMLREAFLFIDIPDISSADVKGLTILNSYQDTSYVQKCLVSFFFKR